jgi:D-beta-D-heptose 7-phosphate kinase/D-beta-D-heptose 1-phosphate adenosyltransferase
MKRVLVIGDTILDEYVYGSIERVNPEAPYSVVLDEESRELKLGGAANVAANIKSIYSIFDDTEELEVFFHAPKSSLVDEMLHQAGIKPSHYICSQKEMLIKTRFVNNNHQIMRLDKNKEYQIDRVSFNQIYRDFESFDAIVFSDYNKGTIIPELIQKALESKKMVFLDLKKSKNLGFDKKSKRYKNLIIKCNRKEYQEEVENTDLVGKCLAIIETRGKDPYCVHSQEKEFFGPSRDDDDRVVVDVVGAGDTFLAGMVVHCLRSSKLDLAAMAFSGDCQSSKKVKYFGTKAIGRDD